MTDDQRQGLEWIRSRPPEIREVMRAFPPSCRVVAVEQSLRCPAPGRVGVVVSYILDKNTRVVELTVADWDDFAAGSGTRHGCKLEWLIPVGYCGNMTPEWVEAVLAGENIPPDFIEPQPGEPAPDDLGLRGSLERPN